MFYQTILKNLFLAFVEIINVCPVGKVGEFYACFLAEVKSKESCEMTHWHSKNNLCFTKIYKYMRVSDPERDEKELIIPDFNETILKDSPLHI